MAGASIEHYFEGKPRSLATFRVINDQIAANRPQPMESSDRDPVRGRRRERVVAPALGAGLRLRLGLTARGIQV